ncbi:related to conserved protein/domain typically associated with flavoprotein oxygenases, DIM6/NTAB family [Phialocephala subalpina]|uniref:Related to conserved protein/domain typically associated with flavoprotein oxygenases, DIM6/NTAB family n=1 Tax=Phialocephala subalpina TaxID=576137 RepID=A0A1L7WNA5_9HELO|nr:related to conserved protein/domain typically associated with flavoprotein oxygenases, DIM6/NTAB family [Phialocephala subalpina]
MFYQPGVTSHGLPKDPFKACVVPRPIGWISTRSADGHDNLAPYSQFNNLTFDPPYTWASQVGCLGHVRGKSNRQGGSVGRLSLSYISPSSSFHEFYSLQHQQQAFDSRMTPDMSERSILTRGCRVNSKDTTINAETCGEFVWNMATYPLREAVNITAEQTAFGVDEFQRANLLKEKATIVKASMVKESPVKFECKYHSTLRLPGNPPMGTVDIIIGLVVGIHISEDVLTDGLVDIQKTQPIARCGYYQYARIRETFDMVIPGGGKVLYGLEGSVALNAKERSGVDKEQSGEVP